MNRRIIILKNTFLEKRFGGNFKIWVLNLFSPNCAFLSFFKISKIIEDGIFKFIYLKDISAPIYLLTKIPIHSIQQVVAEQFYDWHWHNYQVNHTKVGKDDVVFDCGSAEGIFSLMIHDKCRKVYAFEPLDDYLIGLYRTFLDINNVQIVGEALGDIVGSVGFVNSGIQSTVSMDLEDNIVSINTIDNFCESNSCEVNYIKADIEGYEFNLLKGAINSIVRYKPKIAITVYHKANDYNEIRNFLSEIVPEYKFFIKGISDLSNHPVMLHAWVD